MVLALERADVPGAWQMPQGGMDISEEPLETALREAEEETGISRSKLKQLSAFPYPLAYELPAEKRKRKTGRGQVQYWFLFEFLGADAEIRIETGKEFRSWKWMPFSALAKTVVEFRKPVYQALAQHFKNQLAG
jgi:putative (di)nucleoside polyphosphate hydrolase